MRRFITLIPYESGACLSLVEGERVTKTVKISYSGARCRESIKDAARRGIRELCDSTLPCESDLDFIIVSSRATDESGLSILAALDTPTTLRELRETASDERYPDISPLPFILARGIRQRKKDGGRIELRGVEASLYGIIEGAGVYVFAEDKLTVLRVNESGSITELSTFKSEKELCDYLKEKKDKKVFIQSEFAKEALTEELSRSGIESQMIAIPRLEAETRGLIRIANE